MTGSTEIDVVYLEPVTLEPSRVRQRYEHVGDEEVDGAGGSVRGGAVAVHRHRSSGWTSDLWVAGDVVVRYDRLFTLETYAAGASGAPSLP